MRTSSFDGHSLSSAKSVTETGRGTGGGIIPTNITVAAVTLKKAGGPPPEERPVYRTAVWIGDPLFRKTLVQIDGVREQ